MAEERRSCESCKFCVLVDEGCSNYTVENTAVYCGKDKHPDCPFDRFYGNEPKLEYAQKCDAFESGGAISVDVDRENLGDLSAEELAIFKAATGE